MAAEDDERLKLLHTWWTTEEEDSMTFLGSLLWCYFCDSQLPSGEVEDAGDEFEDVHDYFD